MIVAEDGAVTFDFRINLEAFLAGIDLDAVEDTDADPAASDYDALRALPAAEIETRVNEIIAAWNAHPFVGGRWPAGLKRLFPDHPRGCGL